MSGCATHLGACKDAGVKINQVACGSGYIVMGETQVPINAMYDEDGEFTDDVDEVVKVDFGDEEFGYGSAWVVSNPYPYEYLH